MLTTQKRSPRVANDPDKYIRVVKGGRYQARPYLEGERFNLGLFETRHSARAAISLFWWGKLKDAPKYTKRIEIHGEIRFLATIRFDDEALTLGSFATRDEAAAAVRGLVFAIVGADGVDAILKYRDGPTKPRCVHPGCRRVADKINSLCPFCMRR